MKHFFSAFLIVIYLSLTACSSSSDSNDVALTPATVSQSDFAMVAQPLSSFSLAEQLSDRDQRGFLTADLIYGSMVGGKPLQSFIRDASAGRSCDGSWAKFSKNADATFSLSLAQDVSKCTNVAFDYGNGVTMHGPLDAYLETLIVNHAIFIDDNNQVVDVTGMTIDEIFPYRIKQINYKAARVLRGHEQGVPVVFSEKYAVTGSTDFDGICDFSQATLNDCTIQSVKQFDSNGSAIAGSLIVFDYREIGIPPASVDNFTQGYFSSGTIDFEVDYWVGALTYTNYYEAPTYTAEDGQGNLLEGTLLP